MIMNPVYRAHIYWQNLIPGQVLRWFYSIVFIFFAGIALSQDKRVDSKKLFEKGEEAHDAGNYKLALEYLNKCLQESPGFTEAYYTRGSAREQLRDLAGANTDYNIYLEMKPDQPEALLNRATVRYQLKLYDQAKEDFLRLLTLPVGETQAVLFNQRPSASGSNQVMTVQGSMKPLLYNYLGLVDTKLGHYKEAIQWLDSAIRLEQKEADYYVNRGIAKEAMKDSTAIQDYQHALKLRPDHTVALHNLAALKRTSGEPVGMNDYLEQAIGSDSSMLQPYLARAYQRMEGGYYKGALEDYDRALEIDDRNPDIWLNRGLVKEKLNDFKGAFSDYTKAIDLNEKFEKAWLNRGNVLSKQGRFEDAIEDYTVVITYNADNAAAYYNRAIAKQKLKRSPEACEDLQKAASLGMPIPDKMNKEICK